MHKQAPFLICYIPFLVFFWVCTVLLVIFHMTSFFPKWYIFICFYFVFICFVICGEPQNTEYNEPHENKSKNHLYLKAMMAYSQFERSLRNRQCSAVHGSSPSMTLLRRCVESRWTIYTLRVLARTFRAVLLNYQQIIWTSWNDRSDPLVGKDLLTDHRCIDVAPEYIIDE